MPPADLGSFLWCFFGFKGRLSREPYVLGLLASMFVAMMTLRPLLLIDTEAMETGSIALPEIPFSAMPIPILAYIVQLALIIKRLHDCNRSGLYSLIVVVPIINLVFSLILALIPGTRGPNRFGDRANVPPA